MPPTVPGSSHAISIQPGMLLGTSAPTSANRQEYVAARIQQWVKVSARHRAAIYMSLWANRSASICCENRPDRKTTVGPKDVVGAVKARTVVLSCGEWHATILEDSALGLGRGGRSPSSSLQRMLSAFLILGRHLRQF